MGNFNGRGHVQWLLSPEAIRKQSRLLYDSVLKGDSEHFQLHPHVLNETADFVADTIIERYPKLNVPYHSRWRHFTINGQDRSEQAFNHLSSDPLEKARSKVELAIISVFLDAGAGKEWSYEDFNTGLSLTRSEGLAAASLNLFTSGILSTKPEKPLQTDNISNFSPAKLAHAFQVSYSNPLQGLEGRASLITKLGEIMEKKKNIFGRKTPRLGYLVDYLIRLSQNKAISAKTILYIVLTTLGDIWPERIKMNGVNLGDSWYHSKAGESKLVPFHKLSQWLTYSITEPLIELGVRVTQINELTGLAEYRNGGLFLDTGVLSLINEEAAIVPLNPSHSLVVEWRALTICLLDEIANMVRKRLKKNEHSMPLTSILEGGTWYAGRKIAQQKRPGGTPPISIQSDGSVF